MENDWEPWETAPKDMVIMMCYRTGPEPWQYNVITVDWDEHSKQWLDLAAHLPLDKKIKPVAWQPGLMPPWEWELD